MGTWRALKSVFCFFFSFFFKDAGDRSQASLSLSLARSGFLRFYKWQTRSPFYTCSIYKKRHNVQQDPFNPDWGEGVGGVERCRKRTALKQQFEEGKGKICRFEATGLFPESLSHTATMSQNVRVFEAHLPPCTLQSLSAYTVHLSKWLLSHLCFASPLIPSDQMILMRQALSVCFFFLLKILSRVHQ